MADRPDHPTVAVIAVTVRATDVLLVRRANPPDAGRWGFPGGKIDFGETLHDAATRELLEETTVHGLPRYVFTAVDAFDRDEMGEVRQHFVLIAVLCDWVSGEPQPGDDALEARWFSASALEGAPTAISIDVDWIAREAVAAARRYHAQE